MIKQKDQDKKRVETEPLTEKIIPVLEEKIKISKRTRVTGTVRITKKVHEREVMVDEPLVKEEAIIERVPVNRFVQQAPPVREENGTIVIPVIEEVLVVEKKLLLIEELHIRKTSATFRAPRKVFIRKEEALVERLEPED